MILNFIEFGIENPPPSAKMPLSTAFSQRKDVFLNRRGLTLLELIVVLAILVALAGLLVPLTDSSTDYASNTTTRTSMTALRDAILGKGDTPGFVGDLGRMPIQIHELLHSDALPTFDRNTRKGWSGPYVRATDSVCTIDDLAAFLNGVPKTTYFTNINTTPTPFQDVVIYDAWRRPIVIQFLTTTASANAQDPSIKARLLSAGPDGILNTRASDSEVIGDDIALPVKRAGNP